MQHTRVLFLFATFVYCLVRHRLRNSGLSLTLYCKLHRKKKGVKCIWKLLMDIWNTLITFKNINTIAQLWIFICTQSLQCWLSATCTCLWAISLCSFLFRWGGPWVRRSEGRSLQCIYPQHLNTEGGLKKKWETFLPWFAKVLKETERGGKHLVSQRCSSVCRWTMCAFFFFLSARLTQIYILLFWITRCWPIEPNVVSPPPYL